MLICSMDYNQLCSEILNLDGKVRYAGVYLPTSGKIFEKIQAGITRYLDQEQTKNCYSSLHEVEDKTTLF